MSKTFHYIVTTFIVLSTVPVLVLIGVFHLKNLYDQKFRKDQDA